MGLNKVTNKGETRKGNEKRLRAQMKSTKVSESDLLWSGGE